MSARERFFKKVQQKQNPVPPGNGTVEADILAFCQRMDELAQQIDEWFDGIGLKLTVSTKYLQDLSTLGHSLNNGVSRYDITAIIVQNGCRSVSIIPEQLYQNGCRGCVTLTVDAPDREPARQQFYLSMKPEGGWFIREEQQTSAIKSTMTEDVFFRVIDNLA